MSSETWPTGDDARAFIQASQLAVGASVAAIAAIDFNLAVSAAVKDFQKNCGWKPFLAVQQTRNYDPPGPERGPTGRFSGAALMGGSNKLFLGAGLLAVTSLTVGVTPDSEGTALTERRDFWLRPVEAPGDEEPYTYIQFRTTQYGEPESIVIDGLWGYAEELPDTVTRAIICKAAADVAPQLAVSVAQGRASKKAGDEEERFASGRDSGPLSGEAGRWADYYQNVLADYTRASL